MVVIKCFLGLFMGFASHVMFHKQTMSFGKKWGSLLRYAIGYIGCMPLRQIFLDENEKRMSDKVFISDVLTGMMFGGGVFLGYLFDKEE